MKNFNFYEIGRNLQSQPFDGQKITENGNELKIYSILYQLITVVDQSINSLKYQITKNSSTS